MSLRARTLFSISTLAALAACSDASLPPTATLTPSVSASRSSAPGQAARVCPGPTATGEARCHSWVRVDATGKPLASSTPTGGYFPADLRNAYNLNTAVSGGSGKVVAIVDAYDDPNAFNDVNVYRQQFGIPTLPSCNNASPAKATNQPCFSKVNQSGVQSSYPRANGGWAQEISLDIDMASAICPNCSILLVEASSSSLANLGTAVNTAASYGASVISNSYGGSEYSSETSDEKTYYNHPGIAITVSSGDNGYGVEFPAASQYVTAVGGTSLKMSGSSRVSETVWSGAGSGCSAYVAKPTWQTDAGCARRTVADVAAVADPNTGVAVYDSYAYQGQSGWLVFGGTSVASPIIASVYALAGNANTVTYGSYPYSHTSSLFDVTSGSNTSTCTAGYLCSGQVGYDGPTGNGTPNGTTAF